MDEPTSATPNGTAPSISADERELVHEVLSEEYRPAVRAFRAASHSWRSDAGSCARGSTAAAAPARFKKDASGGHRLRSGSMGEVEPTDQEDATLSNALWHIEEDIR